MVVAGQLEKIGDWDFYVRKDELEEALAPLRKSAEQNSANIKTLNDSLEELQPKIETIEQLNETIKNLNSSVNEELSEIKVQINEIDNRTIWTKI